MADLDLSRVKPETWQLIGRALLASVEGAPDERLPAYIRQLRSEAAPPRLRMRAEVDAQIVALARAGNRDGWIIDAGMRALCMEPTAPDPTELGACPPDCDECEPTERPCNCPQALALEAKLDRCCAIVRALRQGEVNGEAAAHALERELGR